MNIYDVLRHLNINYEEVSHDAVFTVEEAKKQKLNITGVGCKNLFLTDHNGSYFLYLLKDDSNADLKSLSKILNTRHLSFASIEELGQILNLIPGGVTPFGIINDVNNKTTILIDVELENHKLLFHPNVNTKTISLEFSDLIKFIQYFKHQYIMIGR